MMANNKNTGEIGQLIEETINKVLSSYCSAEQLKASEGLMDESLWQELETAGLTRALELSGDGELGIPVADAMHIMRVAGGFSTPAPFVETILANALIDLSGLPLTEGPLSIAPVNMQDKSVLIRSGSGWHLSGSVTRIPWARYASAIVVSVEFEEKSFLALVPSSSFEVKHGQNMASEPRDHVTFDVALDDEFVMPFTEGSDHVYALGAAMRVMQMSGALEALLKLTVEYSKDRKQFGRPISKFQAVQHNIAVIAGNVAASRSAANSVAINIADNGAVFGIAAAKIRTNEAATIASRLSHQVHGAMGFTQEYELHFLTKRLWSWRDEFGSEVFWGRKLGREACLRGPEKLWEFITAGMS